MLSRTPTIQKDNEGQHIVRPLYMLQHRVLSLSSHDVTRCLPRHKSRVIRAHEPFEPPSAAGLDRRRQRPALLSGRHASVPRAGRRPELFRARVEYAHASSGYRDVELQRSDVRALIHDPHDHPLADRTAGEGQLVALAAVRVVGQGSGPIAEIRIARRHVRLLVVAGVGVPAVDRGSGPAVELGDSVLRARLHRPGGPPRPSAARLCAIPEPGGMAGDAS